MTGLLKVKGSLDLSQFWPDGESDADTAKVTVGQNAFSFQAHPGAPFKVTHVFDKASVRGKTGTKTAIDKKQRITIRFQGIDATELHF
jgi:endonuclease YncB( thermonuclease family)